MQCITIAWGKLCRDIEPKGHFDYILCIILKLCNISAICDITLVMAILNESYDMILNLSL